MILSDMQKNNLLDLVDFHIGQSGFFMKHRSGFFTTKKSFGSQQIDMIPCIAKMQILRFPVGSIQGKFLDRLTKTIVISDQTQAVPFWHVVQGVEKNVGKCIDVFQGADLSGADTTTFI